MARRQRGQSKSVRYMSRIGESAQCPSEEIWLKLVAGVVKEQQAAQFLRHCSQCSRCAERLRWAEDGLAEEESQSPVMESATEWQLKIAQQMVAQISAARPQKPLGRQLIWILLTAGLFAIVVLALCFSFLEHLRR